MQDSRTRDNSGLDVLADLSGGCSCPAGGPAIRGVILAGVHSWAEDPLDRALARPLWPVMGRPLVQHALDWLTGANISCVTLCGNGDTNALQRAVIGDSSPERTIQFCEDRMPRGPAGCARDAAITCEASTLVLVYGTVIPRLDLAAMLAEHAKSGAAMTVAVRAGADAGPDAAASTPAGVYVISRRVLESVSAQGYHDLKESLIPQLYRRGERVTAYAVPTDCVLPVHDTASYLRANRGLLEDLVRANRVPAGFTRSGDSLIANSARVAPGARLLGPVLVSPGVRVGEDVMIVGPAVVGPDCVVGANAVVTRSVLWGGVHVGGRSVVDGCVLTDAAEVESEEIVRHAVWLAGDAGRSGRPICMARFARRALRRAVPRAATPPPSTFRTA